MRLQHAILTAAATLVLGGAPAVAGDEHWSRQFKKPQGVQKMNPGTGMSDGNTKPRVRRAKWHDGKLWMAGSWEAGISAVNMTKQLRNEYWSLWTWSPESGYEPVCYFHTTHGGAGPDGQIYDFLWLPDGRMVISGAFTRLDNPGGTRFHRVNALAVYDPKEPTADKWQPLGNFQYNGTVSSGGTIEKIVYDPQGNDLYIGGTFGGIRGIYSPKIHRYDFDTKSYEPVQPGVYGAKPTIHQMKVDTSTKPSTIWVGGKFHYTAGNGQNPAVSDSTARYSTGLAKFQLGKGWTTFPVEGAKTKESMLQRAADFMHFDSVHVMDFLVDGEEIWIVGAFSEGKDSGQTLRGVARWDEAKKMWVDPTGKGGVGREIWNIAKAENGKYYFAGAFGGVSKGKDFFDGFKNGDKAHMAMSYDPATKTWEQLGSGLAPLSFPECRLAVNGNDVYFVGDFEYIGPENEKKQEFESHLIARWNETIDFTKNPAQVGAANVKTPAVMETKPLATGNEHWSRAFPAPGRRKRPDQPAHTGKTGMDVGTGTPDVSGLVWLGDTLYFSGSYQGVPNERWYVWSYHAERGWEKLGYSDAKGKKTGFCSPPSGIKAHDGKIWVHGSEPDYRGIGIYDPASKTWSKLTGKANGKEVVGHAVAQGGGTIHDIAWDSKNGDLYMVGASGVENPDYKAPGMTARVIRVDKGGTYHPMGHMLNPEDPSKPVKMIRCVLLDESQDPTDVYIGGTFNYYGPVPTSNSRMLYNVAKWSHADKDWRPLGFGAKVKAIDAKYYPKGYPGLPPRPDQFQGFLRTDFPRVQCLAMDSEGNVYAGGTLAIFDNDTLPVAKRIESFGIAKYDKKQDKWVPCTTAGGLSRDVLQMRWLDDARTQLLLTGAFEYDNAWNKLNGVAILDTPSGELKSLGGGLMRAGRDQVVAPMIRHTVRGSELWFAGLFDHAGANANSRVEAPIQSAYVAMWDPTKNLDPNKGLEVKKVEPITAPAGASSKSFKVALEANVGAGTITWYEKRSNGQFAKKASGPKYSANVRVKGGDGDQFVYVAVTTPEGVEGGKLPVRIPVEQP